VYKGRILYTVKYAWCFCDGRVFGISSIDETNNNPDPKMTPMMLNLTLMPKPK